MWEVLDNFLILRCGRSGRLQHLCWLEEPSKVTACYIHNIQGYRWQSILQKFPLISVYVHLSLIIYTNDSCIYQHLPDFWDLFVFIQGRTLISTINHFKRNSRMDHHANRSNQELICVQTENHNDTRSIPSCGTLFYVAWQKFTDDWRNILPLASGLKSKLSNKHRMMNLSQSLRIICMSLIKHWIYQHIRTHNSSFNMETAYSVG
jgi:hypothetical protein